MDYKLFEAIINKAERSKGEILRESGISYTGFNQAMENKSVKVSFLENFCLVTQTHISRFFEDWYVNDNEQRIPTIVKESVANYNNSYNPDLKLLLQAKEDLITEQRHRIKELTEQVEMFKSGKIQITK
jgi:hypothetical protein